jgi:ATP-binding cassette, subfamily B, bacterial
LARRAIPRAIRSPWFIETEADLKDGPLTLSPEAAQGAIEWRGVGFRYRAEMPVLHSIDLAVEPGMKVAIVGPTGAGKSTMLGLLPRFFDPSTGTVTIGGVDLREFTLKSLRRQIAMVLQPPLIFPISVRDNLAYGRPDATPDEIEEAARLASIHSMIIGLPQGYETVIGESGATLSEGEKQRLTIARALLRDAPILILDEPTSALDVETEAQVMDGIKRLTAGRTTFIIAHRPVDDPQLRPDPRAARRRHRRARRFRRADAPQRRLRRSLQHAIPRYRGTPACHCISRSGRAGSK